MNAPFMEPIRFQHIFPKPFERGDHVGFFADQVSSGQSQPKAKTGIRIHDFSRCHINDEEAITGRFKESTVTRVRDGVGREIDVPRYQLGSMVEWPFFV